ncbi:hypothetical protein AU490_04625 [Lonsdalea populi]|uniref:Uncharacterized protein n=2 Tax=Lonsdalea populi TaxID=1172565 RepID=A0A3N0UND0_9GAMM|nr:hypothetical protein AU490_04625 [Lonsdalea populi]RAT36664.1 hypothetical protein AU491_06185 [Lonsdalea populi]ROH80252.1 hypothetical protein EC393_05160 [Lonsdalea populi]ROH82013.1 hypothetical protein EC392_06520 [Lonsdalea populi]ROH82616.1 hypothetical protein EC394_06640 [Lonsdalea populi]
MFFTSFNGFFFYMCKTTVGESITFFTICSIISLILYFSSEIQEFSIAGNIVKLREVRKKADKVLAELQVSHLAMFKFLLESSKKFGGGFASISPKDERIDDFLFLYENIEQAGLVEELAEKIAGCAELLMRAQVVNCSSSYAKVDCNKYYTPDELTNEALRSENIRQGNSRTEEEDRLLVLEVVSYYRTLYNIFLKAKKYTI